MPVMKAQINMRVNANVNVSYSFESVVDTQQEAENFGDECRRLVDGFIDGYDSENDEDA